MKKEILIGAFALLISAGVSAQEPVQTQTRTQTQDQTMTQTMTKKQQRLEAKAQARAQKQARKMDQSGDPIMSQTQTRTQNHGAVVSETARGTQSGPGKGEVVSTQARNKGESQQARVKANNSAKAGSGMANRPATAPARGAGRK